MYVPAAFALPDIAACHAVIAASSFGLLVTTGADGLPVASHVPFLLDPEDGPSGTLRAHLARANPQSDHLLAGRPALAVFQGPHTYVSPRWYATQPSVPTWNFVAVHAAGTPRVVEGAEAAAVVARLTAENEAALSAAAGGEPWTMDGLPEAFMERMLRGITAFVLPIDRLEGKAKMSQNRSAADRAGVAAGLDSLDDPLARASAALVRG